MEPIRSISHSPVPNFSLLSNSVQQSSGIENVQSFAEDNIQQSPHVPVQIDIDIANHLPQEQTQEVTDIFRSINILANQSLELGQDFNSRESLQDQVEDGISDLRTVLEQFRQDDLRLFTAVFESQIPGGLTSNGSTDNSFASDLFFNDITRNSLEFFFRIDVTSQTGALAALDLTGDILDTFSGNNRGSGSLADLLNNLTISSLVSSILQDDSEEDSQNEDTAILTDSEPPLDIDTEESIIPTPSPTPPGSNPLTIVDFSG